RTRISLYAAHWFSNSGGSAVRLASDDVYKLIIGHSDNIAHDLRRSVDAIAPQVALAVLEPEDAGRGIRWVVLDVGHPHRLPLVLEYLLGVVAVADRAPGGSCQIEQAV